MAAVAPWATSVGVIVASTASAPATRSPVDQHLNSPVVVVAAVAVVVVGYEEQSTGSSSSCQFAGTSEDACSIRQCLVQSERVGQGSGWLVFAVPKSASAVALLGCCVESCYMIPSAP